MTDPIVAVAQGGHVWLLERDTGSVIWDADLAALAPPCAGESVNVSLSDALVLAGCAGHVFAFDRKTGALVWQRDLRSRGDASTDVAIDRLSRR